MQNNAAVGLPPVHLIMSPSVRIRVLFASSSEKHIVGGNWEIMLDY